MNITKKIQAMSHSGAKLTVLKNKHYDFVVCKDISDSIERNHKAILKQKVFQEIITNSYSIVAIPVKSIEKKDESLSIVMPYIEGISGEAFAVHGTRHTAEKLKLSLNAYFIDMLSKSELRVIKKEIIFKKVKQIEAAGYDDEVSPLVIKACQYIRSICNDNLTIPMHKCHGDLTLSNMIVSRDNKLYIFDFLDSFIESPLQDAAKVLQDIEHGWSFRKAKPSIRLKGELFCNVVHPNVIDTIRNIYDKEMEIIEMLTILRVAPYLDKEDIVTKRWFIKTISTLLGKI